MTHLSIQMLDDKTTENDKQTRKIKVDNSKNCNGKHLYERIPNLLYFVLNVAVFIHYALM
jgi:hypothetical protein